MTIFKGTQLTCERFILGALEVNTYLVYEPGSHEALLIDPAAVSPTITERIKELGITDTTIFLTHGHADHIEGVEYFRKNLPAKVAISAEDAPMLTDSHLNLSEYIGEPFFIDKADILLHDGDRLGKNGVVRLLPGHTAGGMILVFPDMVFSGDTLFSASIGRSDFPGGNGPALLSGIKEKIFSLSDRPVFPGHGLETSIEREKRENPFFD